MPLPYRRRAERDATRMTGRQPEVPKERRTRSRDRTTDTRDPDAPGAFVDDDEAAEVPEPNEPG